MTTITPAGVYQRQQQILKNAETIQGAAGVTLSSSPSSNTSSPSTSFSDRVFNTVENVNQQGLKAENSAKAALIDGSKSPEEVAMEIKEASHQVELTGKVLQEMTDSLNKVFNMNF